MAATSIPLAGPPGTDADASHRIVRPDLALDDRYDATGGVVLLSGIQALVRVGLDQLRLDRARGLRTGGYVSGYPGSPLAGVDRELARVLARGADARLVFEPGVNEELAATAVAGTQLVGQLAGRTVDGVVGHWYGKNPGLDRAADAIRHANVSGTAPLGGAVAWVGDDPECKSSTLPSSCEPLCRSLHLPLLSPGSVRDVLELGLHAVALSRHAGTWTGMRIVADVADASATVELDGIVEAIPRLPVREGWRPAKLLPPTSVEAEHDLLRARLERVREYDRLAGLNRVVFEPSRPRLALVASGPTFAAARRALLDLGLGDGELDALGLRLVEIRLPWPWGGEDVRRLVAGVEEVLVLEPGLPFLESAVKEALYRAPDAPRVLGKEDEQGRPLVPLATSLGADAVALALGERLARERLPARAAARLELLARPDGGDGQLVLLPPRAPFFCSGCPHNTSTRAPEEQLVGVGIGCHAMVAFDVPGRGTLVGLTQMGGEGAQWLGLRHFAEPAHLVQNLGDGTFHHSGSLAIRAAVAAGASMTYKLLYNDAVAMTGGQDPRGQIGVPALTRWLAAEGVRRVIVTTDEPEAYRGVELAPIAEVRHRDRLQEAQAELVGVEGVTVLLHDDRCATEERRLRKRGLLPPRPTRAWINERVCEGCGDCGRVSSCLSVVPVETELGRKTRIHQSSCNQDLTCVQGDCPSFLLVEPRERPRRPVPALPVELPEPARRVGDEVALRLPGVGGTGVVTVSQVLQMAAHLEGRHAAGVEQIGLAQKGGPVVSDVRIGRAPILALPRASAASVDVLLGLDVLGAGSASTRATCVPGHTVAVLNTAAVATARMVLDPAVHFPGHGLAVAPVRRATDPDALVEVDALAIAERLFGDHMPANLVVLGAAYQHGCLPVGADSIEQAIRLNGAAVEANLAAFRWGRAAVHAPEAVAAALAPPASREPDASPRVEALLARADGVGPELRRLLAVRVADLVGYQDERLAVGYLDEVLAVAAEERERAPGPDGASPVAEAFARGLHKLLAPKDEYEVARLHLDAAERARLADELGPDARVRFLLQPPLLRALGLRRKMRLGRSAIVLFRVLRAARGLRRTPLDPFRWAHVRRVERALPGEYRELVRAGLERLTPETAPLVVELAGLPDAIRGYEEIKLASVDRFRDRARELLDRLTAGDVGRPAASHRAADVA
ncbi:MAG: indolepyruvate ferredoxin oxidoreductase family protein [Thermoleophilia bacterium]